MAERKEAGMSEHTAGPWQARGNAIYAGHRCVATTEGFKLKTRNADTRLIAAAPDMLTALHHIVECFGVTHKDLYAIQKAHDAIDKAEGREPPHD